MTDLRQSTRDPSTRDPSTRDPSTRDRWTPPARPLERADHDWARSEESTQDATGRERPDSERPAEDGTVYQSAALDSAVDEPVVDEPVVDEPVVDEPVVDGPHVDATAAYEAGVEERTERPSVGDGLDGSVPAGEAGLDRPDPVHAVGVASVPDAEQAPDPEAGGADRGDHDSPGVQANGAVQTDRPAYGINGHPANAPVAVAVAEPEAVDEYDGVEVVTGSGQSVDDVAERAEVAGRDLSMVPVAGDDAVAPAGIGSGELLPGHMSQEPGRALLDGETIERFRDQWRELQLRFVDDPHATASLAGVLVDEAVNALRDSLDQRRAALEDWQPGHGVDAHYGDTERLRVAVRRYRDFLDGLLGQ